MKLLLIALAISLTAPHGMANESGRTAQSMPAAKTGNSAAPATRQPLTDQEAKDLEQRDETPDKSVAGGALSNLHLTYIVIALVTAVILIIALR